MNIIINDLNNYQKANIVMLYERCIDINDTIRPYAGRYENVARSSVINIMSVLVYLYILFAKMYNFLIN